MEQTVTATGSIVGIKNFAYIPAFIIGLGINPEAVSILAIFMILDIILGVTHSAALHGGKSIRSRTLIHGIVSKFLVLIIPAILAYTGKGIGINLVSLVTATMSVLILAETYSMLGHIQSIRTGKDVLEFDAVSLVLKNLRNIIEKLLVSSTKS